MRVAVIPARGGSRRLPRKNVKDFMGKPMIRHAIECAKDSGLFDRIIVSTDDDEIASVSSDCEIHRRTEDDGTRGTQAVTRAAILDIAVACKYVCCIYPTAPLLLPKHLHAGISSLKEREAAFAMAVGTEPLRDAGAFYWSRYDALIDEIPLIGPRTVLIPLPENRVCDINTAEEFCRAEEMYAALR